MKKKEVLEDYILSGPSRWSSKLSFLRSKGKSTREGSGAQFLGELVLKRGISLETCSGIKVSQGSINPGIGVSRNGIPLETGVSQGSTHPESFIASPGCTHLEIPLTPPPTEYWVLSR